MSTTMPKLPLVEDDPNIRTLIATILTTKGYRVRSSKDGFVAPQCE
jgi:DNA-binding response OmpR family regulator